MACEGFNHVLKHMYREERPTGASRVSRLTLRAPAWPAELDDGHGFPSSHSQWMGYFASFLVLHFALHHRFVSTGLRLLDVARDVFLYAFIVVWSVAIAFSRCVFFPLSLDLVLALCPSPSPFRHCIPAKGHQAAIPPSLPRMCKAVRGSGTLADVGDCPLATVDMVCELVECTCRVE